MRGRDAEVGDLRSEISEQLTVGQRAEGGNMKASENGNESASVSRLVPMDAICPDGDFMVRAAIDDDTAAAYAAAMTGGAKFPPVDLFDLPSGDLVIADGWHRYKAAVTVGFIELPANVHTGTREEALLFALKANQQHGLRRTNADKRRAVEVALGLTSAASSRAIADLCGVSHTFVDETRQVATVATCPTSRAGRDGKLYPAERASTARDQEREVSRKDSGEESDSDREAPEAVKDRAREEWQDWSAFEDAAATARDAIALMEGAHVAAKRREMAHAVCGKLAARCKALAARFADDD